MKLSDHAKYYYSEKNQNCAVAILLGSSDKYGLGLDENDAALLVGFGGGMGCRAVCGALSGAIAIIGKLFHTRSDLRSLCGEFATRFKSEFGQESIDCSVLCPKFKTKETRCEAVVVRSADLLESFIEEVYNRENP